MMAGRLRHRINIVKPTPTSTGQRGQSQIVDVVEHANVPAAVLDISGTELESVQQLYAKATTKVIIRYISDLTTQHKIVFGNRTFEIGHIANRENRKIKMTLMCSEVVNE